MRRRSRRPLALVAAGALCLSAALLPAVAVSAQEAPGSGLGSYSLWATAPAMQVRFEDGGYCSAGPTAGCEGVVPEALSSMSNGPIGYALSSVTWPGTLAGNLGSLLLVAGGSQVPPEVTVLNSPVRAEARTGQEPAATTNTSYPGAVMSASATAEEVTSAAELAQGATTPAGGAGNVLGKTRTALTGATAAVAQSESRVSNISLAGGVVGIASVVSTAEATTDGTTAAVTGSTVASGITIAGVPVTVDQNGVTVQGQNAPLNSAANAAVNAAVSQLGLTFALSAPVGEPDGASVTYTAGSLVVSWTPPGAPTMSAVLGGSSVSVTAAPGFAVDLGDLGDLGSFGDVPAAPVDSGLPIDPATGALAGDFGNPAELAGGALGGGGAEVAAAPDPALAQRLSRALSLPSGTGVALLLLGLLGTGLVAAGLKRLPDSVLTATATACPLGEEP